MKASKLEPEQNPYLLTGRGKRKLKRRTIQEADALAGRFLLVSLGLGFGAYVAVVFTTIPHWSNFTRDSWLATALVTFGGALVFLYKALVAFGLKNCSKSNQSPDSNQRAVAGENRPYRKRVSVNR